MLSVEEEYSNIFIPRCSCNDFAEQDETDVEILLDDARKGESSNIVFLWGFEEVEMSDASAEAASLKVVLREIHGAFSEDFGLNLVDKRCGVVVFSKPSLAKSFMEDMEAGNINSNGLKAARYDTYRRVCESGLWHVDLADALNKISAGESKSNLLPDDLDLSDLYLEDESDIRLNGLLQI